MATTPTDQREFRDVLSQFPTGVTVVTSETSDGPVGMTLQSFMSLSLNPPLVLLTADRSSTTWPKIAAERSLAVNVLAENQEGTARQFARSGTDKFLGVDLEANTRSDHPLLKDALAWLDCEIVETYDGGDHVIAICSIRDFAVTGEVGQRLNPLVFFRSAFPALCTHSTVSV